MYLYALIDPVTEETCYIGITKDPSKRFAQHCLVGACTGNINKWIWIRGLSNIRLRPTMVILNENASLEDERNMIQEHWENNSPLLNSSQYKGWGRLAKAKEIIEKREILRSSKWYTNHRETRGISILKLVL